MPRKAKNVSAKPPKSKKPAQKKSLVDPLATSQLTVPTDVQNDFSRDRPAWNTLAWKPVARLPGTSTGKIGATIVLPFRGVDQEDIPDVIQCFGGPDKVAAAARHPHDKSKRLSFKLHQDESISPIAGMQPSHLTAIPVVNFFLLRLELKAAPETATEQQARSKIELSAVQRRTGAKLPPLPPIVDSVTFLYSIKTVFEQDKLYDFALCPALPVDRESVNPEKVQLQSIIPYLLPSYPPLEPPPDENPMHYLYFPALRYTNQTSFSGHECIPSLYTDSLASHERNVVRVRRAHAQVAKWSPLSPLKVPPMGEPIAIQNLLDKVPQDIREKAVQMFQEQPIWVRKVFYAQLSKAKPALVREHRRFVLPALAYKFSNGPWSHSWCRFGYDPTYDVAARQFQILDFRINQALFHPKRLVAKKKAPSERDDLLRQIVSKILDYTSANSRTYTKGFYFLVLLKELVGVPELRNILESADHQSDSCHFQEGFFKKGTMEELRLELTRALFREDASLAETNPTIVRLFKRVGMFRNVILPAETEDADSEDEDELGEGDQTGNMADGSGRDVEMDDFDASGEGMELPGDLSMG